MLTALSSGMLEGVRLVLSLFFFQKKTTPERAIGNAICQMLLKYIKHDNKYNKDPIKKQVKSVFLSPRIEEIVTSKMR